MVRNIALLTGGDSSEWQIALQGAENIGNALDRSRYTPYTIVLLSSSPWERLSLL